MYSSARRSLSSRGSGTRPVTATVCPGFVPQVTCGASAAASTQQLGVEARSVVGGVARPALDALGEVALHAGAALEIGERRRVGRDHPGPRAPLDRHVRDGHAPVHRECADGLARVLDDVAGGPRGGLLRDQAEDQVLRPHAPAGQARERHAHRLRRPLRQRLRGQDVLDLARADAEGERSERTVGGRMRVAADDRHPGLRQAQLRPDHVHDALPCVAEPVVRHAELGDVALERVELRLRDRVGVRSRELPGRHVVVGGGDRAVDAPHAAAGGAQAVEGLRARDLVDEVQVDEEQVVADRVLVPDLPGHRPRRHLRESFKTSDETRRRRG